MISSALMYAIFGGLFVSGMALGYFISQQQVNDLRMEIVDIVNRIAERNAQIMTLRDDVNDLEKEIEFYKAPLVLEYVKSGGIAGIMQSLKIDEFGNIIASSHGKEQQSKLSQQSLSKVKEMLIEKEFFNMPSEFRAALGNADFFSYSLTVTMGGLTKRVVWVDDWAAEYELPKELIVLQAELATIYDSVLVPLNANTEIRNGLKLTVKVDKAQYSSKDIVRISTTLENVSPNTFTYMSPTPCDLNIRIVVKDAFDTYDITYANRAPIQCIQVLQSRELLPEALILQEVEWDTSLTIDDGKINAPDGVYTIEAIFPLASFEESLVTTAVDITIKN
ncbi:MAG: hypothetical protein QXU32_09680 [Nitrososphaerales archaeon]